jgi:hypothetical protein
MVALKADLLQYAKLELSVFSHRNSVINGAEILRNHFKNENEISFSLFPQFMNEKILRS